MGKVSTRKIAVIGLGYVGLPMAVEFGRVQRIIGFDIKQKRIDELRAGVDLTREVDVESLKSAQIHYTADLGELSAADFFIVAVPTPIDSANQPDLTPLIKASETLGKVIKPGDIVVYESTVYPGATEEDCIPVLERVSGLKAGVDFFFGYSPERIVPGDKLHTFTKIKKIVSACDAATLEIVDEVYLSVVEAGTFRASSVRVAEAAKVIENTQRDINIALMNELAVIFKRMDIDTNEVIDAAGSKWNFLKFRPGLVGGHCIGVDPYYLTHKAERLGYIPQVILSGRRINDSMAKFVVLELVKKMIQNNVDVSKATVTVLGVTFKEDCPDVRNTKIADVVRELKEYGVNVQIYDPHADVHDLAEEYGLELCERDALRPADALVVAVSHSEFRAMGPQDLRAFTKGAPATVLMDVKGIFKSEVMNAGGFDTWRM